MKKLHTLDEVSQLIEQGRVLSLAGDKRVLSKLPKGNWVAGSTPYFMDEQQGRFDQERIYVDDFSDHAEDSRVVVYTTETIASMPKGQFDNGFTFLVIPTFSQMLVHYALHADDFDHIYDSPVLGWVSGMNVDSEDKPAVYNGVTGESSSEFAVAMHVKIPDGKMALLEIINIHSQDPDSPIIEFEEDGFSARECLIDGKRQNLAKYITENNIDTKPPITCSYSGAVINVGVKEVNAESGQVDLYAPVFAGREYKFATPLTSYAEEFVRQLPSQRSNLVFSCNCFLNFVYGELKGKKAGFPGPITFGEIAYRLLNQTMTYLEIVDVS